MIFALRDIVFYSYVLSAYFAVPFSTLHDTTPLTFLTYLYNRKRRRIPPITIVHPIIEPLSPMQSNSPLIIEKIQYIIYTRNRPRPTPNSSQKNNDIIFYIIIWCLLPLFKRFGFLFLQRYDFYSYQKNNWRDLVWNVNYGVWTYNLFLQ